MLDYKLEEIIKEALKDYKHFAEVVVKTNPSGTIEIEELSEHEETISKDKEIKYLEDIINDKDELISSLECRIDELEKEISYQH